MIQTAVSLKNISKKFRLFASPTDRLKEALHPFKKKYHKEFWALKDISFDVPKGKTIGIIGRNGSGKSTLLQIICSVLKPTTGTITVNGRISALLELGTDFNPEFTGRENVLTKGIIMGYSQKEIKERLPIIEAFADIGEFIDQPVKTYSSGMFVRLAFATAINVDPDILIIDEALAVGDAKFQRKCYNKFLEFQKEGKTIVFVTHDMNAIVKHCDKAILFEKGNLITYTNPKDVVNRYYKVIFTGDLTDESRKESMGPVTTAAVTLDVASSQKTELEIFIEEIPMADKCFHRISYNKNEYRFGDKRAEIVDYLLMCGENCDPVTVSYDDTIQVYLKVKFYDDVPSPFIGYEMKTIDGVYIFATNTNLTGVNIVSIKKYDVVIFKFSLYMAKIKPGEYFLSFGIAENHFEENELKHDLLDSRNDIIHISILGKNDFDGILDLNTSCLEVSRRKDN